MTETPQLSVPEQQEGMIAPGQEKLVEQIQEGESSIPEKFQNASREDVIKAYQELERMKGQSQEAEAPGTPSSEEPAETTEEFSYTPEAAGEFYGKENVAALAEKGVDMASVMQRADAGEDVSDSYEALAEVFNVSKDVIDNYIQSAQASQGDTPVLNQQDGVDVRNAIGGDQAFKDVTEWAGKNLDKGMLEEYNKIADSNKDAAIWALRAMQGMMGNPNAVVEPKLYGGGTEPSVQKYTSKQQVLDAMNKRNDKGQRLYDIDEAYQQKVAQIMANSDVF
tara:strand:+ start:106 stop:945 length:840 start_codon:yes stop_codon:yes gene_type:complete